MHEARVLVVDDSAAMRALFSDLLDQSKNVVVVGTAASADEARKQIADLKPNVLTLDVEMPGMSGIEFLKEIMEDKPMPVVMLSSLTQAGTDTSLKAYELGAVECFPKPLKATPEQFAKTVGKLGKIVLAAANSNVKDASSRKRAAEAKVAAAAEVQFDWNGHVVALSASMGGIDALGDLLASWPAHCPPTVISLGLEPMVVDAFNNRMAGQLPCTIKAATDGAALTPGTIYIAADPATHALIEAGQPVFVIVPSPRESSELHKKVVSNIEEIRARGARVIAIAEEGDAAVLPHADEVLRIPLAGPLFEPLLAVVPLHIFAMGLATAKGLDVDQPRNLAKSVTVE